MRKLFIILVIVALFGCEEEIPPIELIGSSEIVLKEGTSFTDPGVNLEPDQYEVEGNVDIGTVGVYSLKYTSINGDFVQRTVKVESSLNVDFSLKGEENVVLEIHEIYKEPGYNINVGSVEISGNVNTSELGEYELTYTAINGEELKRTITVVDSTPPEVILTGETVILSSFEHFDEPGFTVTDNSGEDLEVDIEVTYEGICMNISYTAVDSSGNEKSVSREVYDLRLNKIDSLRNFLGVDYNRNIYTTSNSYYYNELENTLDAVYLEDFGSFSYSVEKMLLSSDKGNLFTGYQRIWETGVLSHTGSYEWSKTYVREYIKDVIDVGDGYVVLFEELDYPTTYVRVAKLSYAGNEVFSTVVDTLSNPEVMDIELHDDKILVLAWGVVEEMYARTFILEFNLDGDFISETKLTPYYNKLKSIDGKLYGIGEKNMYGVVHLIDSSYQILETVVEIEDVALQTFDIISDGLYIVLGYKTEFVDDSYYMFPEFITFHDEQGVLSKSTLSETKFTEIDTVWYDGKIFMFTISNDSEGELYTINVIGD